MKLYHGFLQRLRRSKKGAALVEYGLLIAGVALIAAAGVAIFGHKTSDLISAVASVLPGAHADDNGPMFSGKIIETTSAEDLGAGEGIALDVDEIVNGSGTFRFSNNVGWDVQNVVFDEQGN
ncbi:MAG: hypothetical protein RL885_03930 [Planctomycetota bacterium]